MNKLLIMASHDSFIKATFSIKAEFYRRGFDVQYYLVESFGGIDLAHMREIGFNDPFESGPIESIWQRIDVLEQDAICLSLAGSHIEWFQNAFNQRILAGRSGRRPVIFGGYCGLVFKEFLQGYLDRQGLDVFFVNSRHDLELFQSYSKSLNLGSDNLYLSGLPMLDASTMADKQVEEENDQGRPLKAMIFADQPSVPHTMAARRFIIEQLLELARQNPELIVYFKPRHRPSQNSHHETAHHSEKILKSLKKSGVVPSNFILTYEKLSELFPKCDTLLTVSSTAALEAYLYGLRIGIIHEVGISEQFGNYYFIDSGALVTFQEISAGRRNFGFSPQWARQRFLADGCNTQRVADAVCGLIAQQRDTQTAFPARPYLKAGTTAEFREFRQRLASAKGRYSSFDPRTYLRKMLYRVPFLKKAYKSLLKNGFASLVRR